MKARNSDTKWSSHRSPLPESRAAMSITYTATLPVRDETVLRMSALLHAERLRRGTRQGRRVLTCYRQAVLVLRWLLDGTRMSQLARDNAISKSTGYDNLHEGIAVLAAQAPGLHSALLAAKSTGYDNLHEGIAVLAAQAPG